MALGGVRWLLLQDGQLECLQAIILEAEFRLLTNTNPARDMVPTDDTGVLEMGWLSIIGPVVNWCNISSWSGWDTCVKARFDTDTSYINIYLISGLKYIYIYIYIYTFWYIDVLKSQWIKLNLFGIKWSTRTSITEWPAVSTRTPRSGSRRRGWRRWTGSSRRTCATSATTWSTSTRRRRPSPGRR